MDPSNSATPPKLLDFRSGGWILLLAVLLAFVALALHLLVISRGGFRRAIGDGSNPSTYGFDLSTLDIPAQTLVGSGLPKNGIPTLSEPPMLTVADAEQFHAELRRSQHAKFLIPTERVLGIEIDGDARAYPLRLLASHQVVNTTIGGAPLCVSYDPLCDSAVVFDRRLDGGEAPPVQFGFSGLLLNSNLVLYDRRKAPAEESLWSQLLFRAIAGPAVKSGAKLRLIPCRVESWESWSRRYPQTTVMKLDTARLAIYKQTFDAYYNSDRLMFPVSPLPAGETPPLKASVRAWPLGSQWGHLLVASDADQPLAAGADSAAHAHALWFAWHAMHPASTPLAAPP
ncbi:hypothetical protein RAS1_34430 [Phycisphaerae bacterium RAS1]|nr:hypothetical protein RAS1_34430 [Phycisphaerae bacterium RAS1]